MAIIENRPEFTNISDEMLSIDDEIDCAVPAADVEAAYLKACNPETKELDEDDGVVGDFTDPFTTYTPEDITGANVDDKDVNEYIAAEREILSDPFDVDVETFNAEIPDNELADEV